MKSEGTWTRSILPLLLSLVASGVVVVHHLYWPRNLPWHEQLDFHGIWPTLVAVATATGVFAIAGLLHLRVEHRLVVPLGLAASLPWLTGIAAFRATAHSSLWADEAQVYDVLPLWASMGTLPLGALFTGSLAAAVVVSLCLDAWGRWPHERAKAGHLLSGAIVMGALAFASLSAADDGRELRDVLHIASRHAAPFAERLAQRFAEEDHLASALTVSSVTLAVVALGLIVARARPRRLASLDVLVALATVAMLTVTHAASLNDVQLRVEQLGAQPWTLIAGFEAVRMYDGSYSLPPLPAPIVITQDAICDRTGRPLPTEMPSLIARLRQEGASAETARRGEIARWRPGIEPRTIDKWIDERDAERRRDPECALATGPPLRVTLDARAPASAIRRLVRAARDAGFGELRVHGPADSPRDLSALRNSRAIVFAAVVGHEVEVVSVNLAARDCRALKAEGAFGIDLERGSSRIDAAFDAQRRLEPNMRPRIFLAVAESVTGQTLIDFIELGIRMHDVTLVPTAEELPRIEAAWPNATLGQRAPER